MIKLTKRFAVLFFSLMASSVIFFSCTNVDKTLGLEFIPDDEKREFKIDTITVDAYTVGMDSVYTHSPNVLMVGDHKDPIFGLSTAGATFQFLPRYSAVKFGDNPVYKSLTLQMVMSRGPVGNPSSPQTISVYELKDRIYIDSGYYVATPIEEMINNTPLATYTYNGEDTLKIELGSDLGGRLANATENVMAHDTDSIKNSAFFDYVKGLYVVASSASGNERMNFFNSEVTITLALTYDNDDGSSTDTTCIYTSLDYYDYYNSVAYYHAMFNTIEHDYDQADPSLKILHVLNHPSEIDEHTPLDSVVYAQGFFGATPYVKITKEKIKEWLEDPDVNIDDPSQVALVRAELVMELEDFSGFDISKYPAALGGMTLLNHLFTYNYYYGVLYSSGCLNSFYYSNGLFDGKLNRSHRKYSFNITNEIQESIRKDEDLEFYLTPYTSNEQSSQYSQLIYYIAPSQYGEYKAVMGGTTHSAKPFKLVLTYAIPE
ncbi:MAG: DUF4270 domain-containing protein [Prevotellaceae bacterium]|jgi:hypothetical protein|nr:DUF4270 domain-containing protein [Prevotellaceae bacterium]